MAVNRKDRLILQLNVVPVGAARCSVHENEVDVSVNSPIRRCGKAARKNIPHFAVCSVKRVPVRVAGKKRIVFAGRLASVFVYVFNRFQRCKARRFVKLLGARRKLFPGIAFFCRRIL